MEPAALALDGNHAEELMELWIETEFEGGRHERRVGKIDALAPERAGSLMTLQTALGFLVTALTVQAAPALAAAIGWPWVLAVMSLGPAAGIRAMQLLMRN